jgi:hypothetical protein
MVVRFTKTCGFFLAGKEYRLTRDAACDFVEVRRVAEYVDTVPKDRAIKSAPKEK